MVSPVVVSCNPLIPPYVECCEVQPREDGWEIAPLHL